MGDLTWLGGLPELLSSLPGLAANKKIGISPILTLFAQSGIFYLTGLAQLCK